MTALVATDLDGTLVYSRRSAGEVPPSAVAVEWRGGACSAWVTASCARSLAALGEAATWVPATTRTVVQFRRLRLPGRHHWVVCAQGGVLLVDGVVDATWAATVRRRVAQVATLDEVARGVRRRLRALPREAVGPLRHAERLFLAARVDLAGAPAGWVDELGAFAADRGWEAVVGERKMHVVPRGLSKAAAVAEVRRRCGAGTVLAAGDSRLDADLLVAADAGIRPAHGELHALGRHADHVAVTSSSGIRAGEEITEWLLARIGRSGGRR